MSAPVCKYQLAYFSMACCAAMGLTVCGILYFHLEFKTLTIHSLSQSQKTLTHTEVFDISHDLFHRQQHMVFRHNFVNRWAMDLLAKREIGVHSDSARKAQKASDMIGKNLKSETHLRLYQLIRVKRLHHQHPLTLTATNTFTEHSVMGHGWLPWEKEFWMSPHQNLFHRKRRDVADTLTPVNVVQTHVQSTLGPPIEIPASAEIVRANVTVKDIQTTTLKPATLTAYPLTEFFEHTATLLHPAKIVFATNTLMHNEQDTPALDVQNEVTIEASSKMEAKSAYKQPTITNASTILGMKAPGMATTNTPLQLALIMTRSVTPIQFFTPQHPSLSPNIEPQDAQGTPIPRFQFNSGTQNETSNKQSIATILAKLTKSSPKSESINQLKTVYEQSTISNVQMNIIVTAPAMVVAPLYFSKPPLSSLLSYPQKQDTLNIPAPHFPYNFGVQNEIDSAHASNKQSLVSIQPKFIETSSKSEGTTEIKESSEQPTNSNVEMNNGIETPSNKLQTSILVTIQSKFNESSSKSNGTPEIKASSEQPITSNVQMNVSVGEPAMAATTLHFSSHSLPPSLLYHQNQGILGTLTPHFHYNFGVQNEIDGTHASNNQSLVTIQPKFIEIISKSEGTTEIKASSEQPVTSNVQMNISVGALSMVATPFPFSTPPLSSVLPHLQNQDILSTPTKQYQYNVGLQNKIDRAHVSHKQSLVTIQSNFIESDSKREDTTEIKASSEQPATSNEQMNIVMGAQTMVTTDTPPHLKTMMFGCTTPLLLSTPPLPMHPSSINQNYEPTPVPAAHLKLENKALADIISTNTPNPPTMTTSILPQLAMMAVIEKSTPLHFFTPPIPLLLPVSLIQEAYVTPTPLIHYSVRDQNEVLKVHAPNKPSLVTILAKLIDSSFNSASTTEMKSAFQQPTTTSAQINMGMSLFDIVATGTSKQSMPVTSATPPLQSIPSLPIDPNNVSQDYGSTLMPAVKLQQVIKAMADMFVTCTSKQSMTMTSATPPLHSMPSLPIDPNNVSQDYGSTLMPAVQFQQVIKALANMFVTSTPISSTMMETRISDPLCPITTIFPMINPNTMNGKTSTPLSQVYLLMKALAEMVASCTPKHSTTTNWITEPLQLYTTTVPVNQPAPGHGQTPTYHSQVYLMMKALADMVASCTPKQSMAITNGILLPHPFLTPTPPAHSLNSVNGQSAFADSQLSPIIKVLSEIVARAAKQMLTETKKEATLHFEEPTDLTLRPNPQIRDAPPFIVGPNDSQIIFSQENMDPAHVINRLNLKNLLATFGTERPINAGVMQIKPTFVPPFIVRPNDAQIIFSQENMDPAHVINRLNLKNLLATFGTEKSINAGVMQIKPTFAQPIIPAAQMNLDQILANMKEASNNKPLNIVSTSNLLDQLNMAYMLSQIKYPHDKEQLSVTNMQPQYIAQEGAKKFIPQVNPLDVPNPSIWNRLIAPKSFQMSDDTKQYSNFDETDAISNQPVVATQLSMVDPSDESINGNSNVNSMDETRDDNLNVNSMTDTKNETMVAYDDLQDVSIDVSQGTLNVEAQDVTNDGSQDVPNDGSQDVTNDGSQDVTNDGSQGVTNDGSQDISKIETQDVPNDGSQDPSVESQDVTKSEPHDNLKDASKIDSVDDLKPDQNNEPITESNSEPKYEPKGDTTSDLNIQSTIKSSIGTKAEPTNEQGNEKNESNNSPGEDGDEEEDSEDDSNDDPDESDDFEDEDDNDDLNEHKQNKKDINSQISFNNIKSDHETTTKYSKAESSINEFNVSKIESEGQNKLKQPINKQLYIVKQPSIPIHHDVLKMLKSIGGNTNIGGYKMDKVKPHKRKALENISSNSSKSGCLLAYNAHENVPSTGLPDIYSENRLAQSVNVTGSDTFKFQRQAIATRRKLHPHRCCTVDACCLPGASFPLHKSTTSVYCGTTTQPEAECECATMPMCPNLFPMPYPNFGAKGGGPGAAKPLGPPFYDTNPKPPYGNIKSLKFPNPNIPYWCLSTKPVCVSLPFFYY